MSFLKTILLYIAIWVGAPVVIVYFVELIFAPSKPDYRHLVRPEPTEAKAEDRSCVSELMMRLSKERISEITNDPAGYLSSIEKILSYRRREETTCAEVAQCIGNATKKTDDRSLAIYFKSCLEEQ